MPLLSRETLEKKFPVCHAFLRKTAWNDIVAGYLAEGPTRAFDRYLKEHEKELGGWDFLTDLARLEGIVEKVGRNEIRILSPDRSWAVNPSVHVEKVSWQGLPALFEEGEPPRPLPEKKEEAVLVWRHPISRIVMIRTASDADLLALKIAAEGLDYKRLAEEGGVPRGIVDAVMARAVDEGLIIAPRSRIRRHPEIVPPGVSVDDEFLESPFFTVQLHITQACDLQCRHCYDRSQRKSLSLKDGLVFLDDLADFCRDRRVRGQVSFTGGNPLLHPHFFEIYQAAVDLGFVTAILGNPTARENLERMTLIRKPAFYQVSLEGLEKHNDSIRGEGSFRSVLEFLPLLKEYGISSMVMLTLTRDNMDQVIPLGERLRGLTDSFNFNRLVQVGEGAALSLPSRGDYKAFLLSYLEALERNPVLGLKDNLFNIILRQEGKELFGGCAGYGCSAAFNFLAVLSDGEVHACRKFPSLVGNIHKANLADIYDSENAERYRRGTAACRDCPIRPVCGSCLAVMYGQGLDIFNSLDPHCFMEEAIGGSGGRGRTKITI